MHRLAKASKKTVGIKQTLKAVENGWAELVYVAKDAEEKLRHPALQTCREKGIPVLEVESMKELGYACSIQVPTAVAAILK